MSAHFVAYRGRELRVGGWDGGTIFKAGLDLRKWKKPFSFGPTNARERRIGPEDLCAKRGSWCGKR